MAGFPNDQSDAAGAIPVWIAGVAGTTDPIADGQLLIGNGDTMGFDLATLTPGSNITITNTPGGIEIAAAGGGGSGTVTQVDGKGTVNGITLTGSVTTAGDLTLGGALTGVDLTKQVTGILPVPNGGTGVNALTGLVVGNGAGVMTTVTAPTGAVVGTTDTQTLTAKRITKRVTVAADATAITPAGDTSDIVEQVNTQSAGALTVNAPTGTPTDGQQLILRLVCTNAQTFSWNAAYQGSTDLSLPTTSSTGGKYDYLAFIWNQAALKWQLLAKNFGF